MLDALVIGAGPSGSRTAWNLAKAGYSTSIVEEHEIVGEPCQCAGLITPRTFEYLGYRRPVSQEMNGARLWGPKESFLNFQANETKALVIDRPDLDRSIAEKATDCGADLKSGHRYLGHRKSSNGIIATIQNYMMNWKQVEEIYKRLTDCVYEQQITHLRLLIQEL